MQLLKDNTEIKKSYDILKEYMKKYTGSGVRLLEKLISLMEDKNKI